MEGSYAKEKVCWQLKNYAYFMLRTGKGLGKNTLGKTSSNVLIHIYSIQVSVIFLHSTENT